MNLVLCFPVYLLTAPLSIFVSNISAQFTLSNHKPTTSQISCNLYSGCLFITVKCQVVGSGVLLRELIPSYFQLKYCLRFASVNQLYLDQLWIFFYPLLSIWSHFVRMQIIRLPGLLVALLTPTQLHFDLNKRKKQTWAPSLFCLYKSIFCIGATA